MAPAYSSLLFGLAITFGSLAGLVANILAGFLIKKPTLFYWRRMFILFIIVYTIGGLIYLLFGSGVPRKWAEIVHHDHHPTNDKNNGEEIVEEEIEPLDTTETVVQA